MDSGPFTIGKSLPTPSFVNRQILATRKAPLPGRRSCAASGSQGAGKLRVHNDYQRTGIENRQAGDLPGRHVKSRSQQEVFRRSEGLSGLLEAVSDAVKRVDHVE